MTVTEDAYPAPQPGPPPRELFPGLWLASVSHPMGIPLGLTIRFSRNMVAVLADDGWVLLNPVRLGAEAEQQLLARGPIRHAVRLGTFHGRDDRYYVEQHGAAFWAVPGRQAYEGPTIDHPLSEGGAFPLADAQVVVFREARQAECVVLLRGPRLLVTCDSVQHYENDGLISWLGRQVMRRMGFFTPCVIGPIWLREMTPRGGSLEADFERVLALDFDHLVAGHGTPCMDRAKSALTDSVNRQVRGR